MSRRVAGLLLLAAVGSCSDQSSLADEVGRIDVTPGTIAMTQGEDSVIAAEVRDPSGQLISGRRVFWSSSTPTVATVSTAGIVSAVSPGTARIAASAGGKSGLAQVTVTPPPIALVRVTPSSSGVGVGSSLALRADALETSGDTSVGRPVTWRSSSTSVATVNASGVVQGVVPGTVSITATVAGVSGTAVIAVQAVSVARVVVAPTTATMMATQSVTLTATLQAANGSAITGRFITWTSSAPGIATVSSSGVVTGLAAGTATITASSEGRSASAVVTVVPVPVARVSIVPATVNVGIGKSSPLVALPFDSVGNLLGGRTATWTSAAPTVATVSTTGVVTGVIAGTTRITATIAGRSATADVTVTAVPVARVTVAPASTAINRNQTFQLTATVLDAQGQPLTGRVVSWVSGSSTIARVSSTGLVTGLSRGTVLIFAESEGVRGSASITVQ